MQAIDQNGMVANPAKFQMMFLGNKVGTEFYLNVNGKITPENKQVKLLGVTIDSNFNFNSHIKEIWRKVNQKTTALARLCEYISEKSQIITEYGCGVEFPILPFNMVAL